MQILIRVISLLLISKATAIPVNPLKVIKSIATPLLSAPSLLAIQYPKGYCKGRIPFDKLCAIPSDKWSIHGLWEGKKTDMQSCNGKALLSTPIEVSTVILRNDVLREKVEKEWSSNFGSNSAFWTRQWNKHGVRIFGQDFCQKTPDRKALIETYFSTTVDLFEQISVQDALDRQGLVPSVDEEYSLQQLNEAARKSWNTRVQWVCKEFEGVVYLIEVRLPVNGLTGVKESNCPNEGIVLAV